MGNGRCPFGTSGIKIAYFACMSADIFLKGEDAIYKEKWVTTPLFSSFLYGENAERKPGYGFQRKAHKREKERAVLSWIVQPWDEEDSREIWSRHSMGADTWTETITNS